MLPQLGSYQYPAHRLDFRTAVRNKDRQKHLIPSRRFRFDQCPKLSYPDKVVSTTGEGSGRSGRGPTAAFGSLIGIR
jgi:hypothetical protein